MNTRVSISIVAVFALWANAMATLAADKTIGVFVALADNASQGIVPVPAAIGDGEDPERNLYWGTAEGLRGVFDKSSNWQLTKKRDGPEGTEMLRVRTYQHVRTGAILSARAYRGTGIKRCVQDFEAAIQRGTFDLIVFIGHNGLMDFSLPVPARRPGQMNTADCVVLCCKSDAYFRSRIESAGGRPVLLTRQLMYPGSFILHAVAEGWLNGATTAELREYAGEAYAANQKLSKRAGVGVFAKIEEPATSNSGVPGRLPMSPTRHP